MKQQKKTAYWWQKNHSSEQRKKKKKYMKDEVDANLPVVLRRAPAIVVREPAKRRIRPLLRRCCCECKLCWLPVARIPSELRRPSCTVSENTDVDVVEAVESPRRLKNEPPLPFTPLDDVVVADESLRENIDWPSDDNLSLDSTTDLSWSSLLRAGARRRLQRIERINANIKKNVAIIAQPQCSDWPLSFYLIFVFIPASVFAIGLWLFCSLWQLVVCCKSCIWCGLVYVVSLFEVQQIVFACRRKSNSNLWLFFYFSNGLGCFFVQHASNLVPVRISVLRFFYSFYRFKRVRANMPKMDEFFTFLVHFFLLFVCVSFFSVTTIERLSYIQTTKRT